MGHSVQTAVDASHHLIVAHEVTDVGHARAQLSKMAKAAREAMGKTKPQALADCGYFNGTELKACEDAGITTYVPKPMTSNVKAEGRFDKSDFIYIAKDDEYQCPVGVQQRLDRKPVAMTLRRCTVEHVFGTLKYWIGWTHFLTRKLEHVGTEMSLHVLANNLKRVIAILGISRTMKAMRLLRPAATRLERKVGALIWSIATLGHHLQEVAKAQLETQVPPNAKDDDLTLEVPAFNKLQGKKSLQLIELQGL